jgi:hypothetical protein
MARKDKSNFKRQTKQEKKATSPKIKDDFVYWYPVDTSLFTGDFLEEEKQEKQFNAREFKHFYEGEYGG